MKKVFIITFLILGIIILKSCKTERRLDFCECYDIKSALTDSLLLSKSELRDKQEGCNWIEEELSPLEIQQKFIECIKNNKTTSNAINEEAVDTNPIQDPIITTNVYDIPTTGKAICISEFAYIYSSPDINSATGSYYTTNDTILYYYNNDVNGFLDIYQEGEDGSKNFVGYGLVSDYGSFEASNFSLPLP